MSVETNRLVSNVLQMESGSLPNLPVETTKIFSLYGPSFEEKPCSIKNSVDSLQSAQKKLLNGPKEIRKAKIFDKMHKIIAITLLALTVAIIATAAILGTLVNPALGAIAFALIATWILSSIKMHAEDSRYVDYDPRLLPLVSEIHYVYKAFTTKKFKIPTIEQRELNEQNAKNHLVETLEKLRELQEQKEQVVEGIEQELRGIDLTRADANMARVNELRAALASLEKIEEFLEGIEFE